MTNALPTVKVANAAIAEGFSIVNESDLTEEMVLFDVKAETARRKKMKSSAAAQAEAAALQVAAETAALQAIQAAAAAATE